MKKPQIDAHKGGNKGKPDMQVHNGDTRSCSDHTAASPTPPRSAWNQTHKNTGQGRALVVWQAHHAEATGRSPELRVHTRQKGGKIPTIHKSVGSTKFSVWLRHPRIATSPHVPQPANLKSHLSMLLHQVAVVQLVSILLHPPPLKPHTSSTFKPRTIRLFVT